MPGSQREVLHAEEEGVAFDWLAAPKAVRGGALPGVKAARMRLGAPDASGRQTPEEAPDGCYDVPGDLVIAALGFDAEDLSGWGVATTRWGALEVNPQTYATNLPGVHAAGDIVRGASLVVWAIREGRDAADAMHAWIQERAKVAAE
jgi:glutamate synthase (NADPH/NADH) small chain